MVTVSALVATWKDAVTFRAVLIVTVQAPVPEQPPDQPAKTASPTGVAVSVTTEPADGLAVQAPLDPAPQSMPDPVTVPLPVTATVKA
jgi:hypothetical protein